MTIPLPLEIAPHSPQRSCPAFCSSDDSRAFNAGSGIQVLLQSAPVELDELEMLGINNLADTGNHRASRCRCAAECLSAVPVRRERLQFLFPITADQLASLAAAVAEGSCFLFVVLHDGDSSQKLRVDGRTACLFPPMGKNRPRSRRSESDSGGNASAPFQGLHRTTQSGHPQRW